jgi:hypothetical protein
MAQTLAQSFYLGPFAVYTSPSGMTDPITGVPYLGGTLHEGDYVDLTREEAAQWNVRFGSNLNTGRYRLVRLSTRATAANIGFGFPVGWGAPTTVGQVALAAAGSGATTDGTYTISSTTSGGTAKATALATVSGGVITAVQLTFGGAGFTSVPTFGLTEIAGLSAGSVLAQMSVSPNFISSLDATAIDVTDVRGIALTTITAAQITANAWIVIQELGVAPLFVTTANATAGPGNQATAANNGVVSTASAGTGTNIGYIGQTLDTPAASTLVRVDLALPVRQG